jgi:hypothetical protein
MFATNRAEQRQRRAENSQIVCNKFSLNGGSMSGDSEEKESYVRDWKARGLVLRGKGFFRSEGKSWSSELAYVRVHYDPQTDTIKLRKRWPQRSTDGSETWVHPNFHKKTQKLFLKWARDAYLNRYMRSGGGQGSSNARLKGHRQDLCSMCQEKGRLCILKKGEMQEEGEDQVERSKTARRRRRRGNNGSAGGRVNGN